MVDFAVTVASTYNTHSPHDEKRLACAQLMKQIYDIMKSEPRFPSLAARAEITRSSSMLMLFLHRPLHGSIQKQSQDVETNSKVPPAHPLGGGAGNNQS